MKKPTRASVADLNLQIEDSELSDERIAQVNSILRIITESIEKLKISLILPKIFEDPITVRQYLSNTEYEECMRNLESFLKTNKNKKISTDPAENFRLVRIIDMFQEKYKMINLLPQHFSALSEDDNNLLDSFRLLYTITEAHLKKSAASELSKEKLIHQIYHENEVMKNNIIEFQKKLRNQKINLRWKIAAKDGVIQKYEESLAYKKWDNNIRIQQEIAKSTRAIRAIHTASVARQKELEEEVARLKANYEKVLKQNLHQEKHARDEKNKLLVQLQILVRKYDSNIGDKIKENMHVQEIYDEQKKQFDEFLVYYHREEQEFETIMNQRAEEERRNHEEKIMIFIMNRAARIIQRYWRKWRKEQKKKTKVKATKGKRK